MRILHVRPSRSAGKVIAEFDLELNEHCRLYRLRLVEEPNGRRLTYAPMAGGVRTATFIGEFADQITTLASKAVDGALTPMIALATESHPLLIFAVRS